MKRTRAEFLWVSVGISFGEIRTDWFAGPIRVGSRGIFGRFSCDQMWQSKIIGKNMIFPPFHENCNRAFEIFF
jgi:hypothetical protein